LFVVLCLRCQGFAVRLRGDSPGQGSNDRGFIVVIRSTRLCPRCQGVDYEVGGFASLVWGHVVVVAITGDGRCEMGWGTYQLPSPLSETLRLAVSGGGSMGCARLLLHKYFSHSSQHVTCHRTLLNSCEVQHSHHTTTNSSFPFVYPSLSSTVPPTAATP
jgi:hypothetical protein